MSQSSPSSELTKRWRRIPAVERYGIRVTLFGLAVALVGIPFGVLLQQVLWDGPLTRIDLAGAQWLHREIAGNAFVIGAMEAVSFTGKPIFLTFAVGIPGAWLLARGRHKLVLFLAVTCIGGGAIDTVVKLAVGRPRPQLDEPVAQAFGNSFPSGHSMSSLVCYGSLVLVFMPLFTATVRRVVLVAVPLLVVSIGLSRLALGVHYMSDVLGGYVLGAAWLAASVAAFELWRDDRGRPTTDPLEEGVEPEETKDLASA